MNIITGKDYIFDNNYFKKNDIKYEIPYHNINEIKKEPYINRYHIKYFDNNGKLKKTYLDASEENVTKIDDLLETKFSHYHKKISVKSFAECFSTWINFSYAMLFFSAIIFAIMYFDMESVHVPVVLVPFIYFALNIGAEKLIIINVVIFLLVLLISFLEYSKKRTYEIIAK